MLNQLIGLSPWTIPFLPAVSGRMKGQLPVFDLTDRKDDFRIDRKHIRPLPVAMHQQISFSAWRIAHAIKKAEYTRAVSSFSMSKASLGFLLEHGEMFDWSNRNFRLCDDAISLLDDFSRTGLAGRVRHHIDGGIRRYAHFAEIGL